MNIKNIIFLILLIFLIPYNSYSKFKKYKLVRIVDGDTIVINNGFKNMKIRLLYIDTPEKYSPHNNKFFKDMKRCHINKHILNKMGEMATNFLLLNLYNHNYIYADIKGKGYYGRYLGVIKLSINDKYSINYRMVRFGYACKYKYYNGKYYKEIEKESENKRMGLWEIYYNEMKCLCLSK